MTDDARSAEHEMTASGSGTCLRVGRAARRFLCLANPIPLHGGILFGGSFLPPLLHGRCQCLWSRSFGLARHFRGLFRVGYPGRCGQRSHDRTNSLCGLLEDPPRRVVRSNCGFLSRHPSSISNRNLEVRRDGKRQRAASGVPPVRTALFRRTFEIPARVNHRSFVNLVHKAYAPPIGSRTE